MTKLAVWSLIGIYSRSIPAGYAFNISKSNMEHSLPGYGLTCHAIEIGVQAQRWAKIDATQDAVTNMVVPMTSSS